MTYLLSVVGEPGPRAKIDVGRDDALRIAQGLANTEGVDVEVIGDHLAVAISGDEEQFPELTLEERCWIVQDEVLWEMHSDAKAREAHAERERETIMNEILKRSGYVRPV